MECLLCDRWCLSSGPTWSPSPLAHRDGRNARLLRRRHRFVRGVRQVGNGRTWVSDLSSRFDKV